MSKYVIFKETINTKKLNIYLLDSKVNNSLIFSFSYHITEISHRRNEIDSEISLEIDLKISYSIMSNSSFLTFTNLFRKGHII